MKLSGIVCVIAGGLTAIALSLAQDAHAETGTKPHLDQLCTHPAFVSVGAPVTIRYDVRQERVLASNPVGLRAQNDYCGSDDFKHPADYGSGPAIP